MTLQNLLGEELGGKWRPQSSFSGGCWRNLFLLHRLVKSGTFSFHIWNKGNETQLQLSTIPAIVGSGDVYFLIYLSLCDFIFVIWTLPKKNCWRKIKFWWLKWADTETSPVEPLCLCKRLSDCYLCELNLENIHWHRLAVSDSFRLSIILLA